MSSLKQHLECLTECPITRQELRWMNADELTAINARIAAQEVAHLDTMPVEQPLTAGLISEDGAVVYPVVQDIALLLPDFAIILNTARLEGVTIPEYQPSVREFYDSIGWKQAEDGFFVDAHRYEDLRPAAHDYVYDCHLRVNKHLPARGEYILDVASGPIQYPTYLTYSENFDIRVCVDVSFQALVGAKQRVPEGRGVFVLGNIRNLPFKADAFDAIVSLHTVYHIVAEQQHAVFDELHRVLKPAGRAVVVYTWGNISPLNQPAAVLSKIGFAISQRLRRMIPAFTFLPEPIPEDTFYYHPHRSGWFRRQRWDYPFAILCWRSVSVGSSKLFLHGWPGKQVLRLFFWWEDRFPKFTAFLGQYPMFLIDKR